MHDEQKYASKEQQLNLLNHYFMSTKEALDTLQISQQSFHSLINRNKLTRIKKAGVTLYFREEIEGRKRQQEELRRKYRPFEYERRKQ